MTTRTKNMVVALGALCAMAGLGAAPKEGTTVHVQDRDVYVHSPNYDKAKIPPYTLEDPLTFIDGRKVTKETWPQRRREILDLFAKEMYGAEPPAPKALITELVNEKVDWPASYDTSAIGPHLGYVRRSERHGISAYDWTWMLDFADRNLGRR